MGIFTRFKIRTKLGVLIGCMLTGLFMVGGIGYYFNWKSNETLNDLYKENSLIVQTLSDANSNSNATYGTVIRRMVNDNDSMNKDMKADIKTHQKQVDDDIKSIDRSALEANEKKELETIEANISEWNSLVQKAMDLCEDGQQSVAISIFNVSGNATFDKLQESFDTMLNGMSKDSEVVFTQSQKSADAAANMLALILTITAGVCIALGLIIAFSITKPIKKLNTLILKTANLELKHDVSYDAIAKNKDEVGVMVHSVQEMRKSLKDVVSQIVSIANTLASNSEELTATTDENVNTLNQVTAALNDIAVGNGSQAETVNKVSLTITEVSKSIDEVNKTASVSAENAEKSKETVLEGQNAVEMTLVKMQDNVRVSEEVNQSIQELSALMNKVSSITEVINSIASQTNLLALNAAIEAARAGEAGKGFAVVAEEIRQLAEGSSSAAQEISEIINTTVEKNKAATQNIDRSKKILADQEKAMNLTKEVFENIRLSVNSIAENSKESSVMMKQIDESAREIAAQTEDMAAIAQESASSSEEVSASSEEQLASIQMIAQTASDLSDMATDLNQMLSKFTI